MKRNHRLAALAASSAMFHPGSIGGFRRPGMPQICFKNEDGNGSDVAVIGPDDIAALNKKLAEIGGQVKEFGTEFVKKIEAGDKISADLKEKTDKALADQGELRSKIDELNDRAKEIEQTVARRSTGGEKSAAQKTPGELFLEDAKVKEFLAQGFRSRGRVRADMAVITTAAMSGLVQPDRIQGIVSIPERTMTVRDLLTPGRTTSNSIQYWQETGFTNNAHVVSEGVSKPESTITGSLVTANVATIAHVMIAAKQIIEDAPALQSQIDGRLRYGLAYAEEAELLSGDGTGVHILGIIPQATTYSANFTPEAPSRIDTMRLAILQSELALFPATGTVLNPIDWARIELTKDAEGRYIFVQPQSETTPRLWGRPIVSTPALSANRFLTGAFKLGAQIFDREDANVEISTEDGDNFRKNLLTLRAEERLALAVYRPQAFVYGTFQAAT